MASTRRARETTCSSEAMPPLELRRRYRIARRTVGGWALRGLGPASLQALARTWQVEELGTPPDSAPASSGGRGALICLWHGRMACGLVPYAGRGWSVLVSPSDDGELSGHLLARNGYRVIRGSTSRGGARALREMLARLEDGARVILTPDGPRGPRHRVNPGVAWMARETGLSVFPLGVACDRAWRLSSWDRFTIPRPGARVVFAWGQTLRAHELGGDSGERSSSAGLGTALEQAEREAFAHLGLAPDWELAPDRP